jgi:restriction endonuclease Mrr
MLQQRHVRGWFFSRNGFSQGARNYAKSINEEIALIDGP